MAQEDFFPPAGASAPYRTPFVVAASASAPVYPGLEPPVTSTVEASVQQDTRSLTYSEQALTHTVPSSSSGDGLDSEPAHNGLELLDGEISLDSPLSDAVELQTGSRWALPWTLWPQRSEIVIAHPDATRKRGLVLVDLSGYTRDDAEAILTRVREQLAEHIDGNRLSPTMYQDLIDQPKLRRAYVEPAMPTPSAPVMPASAPSATVMPTVPPPVEPSSSSTAPPGTEAENDDCPICMENINPADAVLRCQSVPCHFFHQRCLQVWIRQCQRGNATCPMCRQGLDIHGARLNDFLNGTASANLTEEDRTFLQTLLERIPNREEWADLVTVENAQYVGGILASFGYGFFRGYNNVFGGGLGHFQLSRNVQVAEGFGFAAGAIIRAVKDYNRRERDESNRKRR